MGWLCTWVWGLGVLVGVAVVVGVVVGFAYWCGGFHCLVACVVVFGCGSVMIGVTPVFGCVCDTM